MLTIGIRGAEEGNLKNISVDIPKNKIVVFTGLAGAGKSTLLVDVLYNECLRQYLAVRGMRGFPKPKVERIEGIAPAIQICPTDLQDDLHTAVGDATAVYDDLAIVFEKLGVRSCPHCGEKISAASCRHETVNSSSGRRVYMYCDQCGERMDKITRSYFSYGSGQGECPACEGLGRIYQINKRHVVNERKSLEDGAVLYWEQRYALYQTAVIYAAFKHYRIAVEPHTPVEEFSDIQKSILYDGVDCDSVRTAFPDVDPPRTVALGKFEGVFPLLWRRLSGTEGDIQQIEQHFDAVQCPTCKGERFDPVTRSVTVAGVRYPELASYSLYAVKEWAAKVERFISDAHRPAAGQCLVNLKTRAGRFACVGLGHLRLGRETTTLAIGDLQRLRIAAVLNFDLAGLIYILDEPTLGLHPSEIKGLIGILREIRDAGNSVLVIEYDPKMISAADYIIDLGPGGAEKGGQIVAAGTPEEVSTVVASSIAPYLRPSYVHHGKTAFRRGSGKPIVIRDAGKRNIGTGAIVFPARCLTTVTGQSGTGKSTLLFELLVSEARGLEQFSHITALRPVPLLLDRFPVVHYSQVYRFIKELFAGIQEARDAKLMVNHFSFSGPGGRCEKCGGLGSIQADVSRYNKREIMCPVCRGNRFNADVLAIEFAGLSIKDVLDLSVTEAFRFFSGHEEITANLSMLRAVGLGYLKLGQIATSLSRGERQRLKFAAELLSAAEGPGLFILEEPTISLHPRDAEQFILFLDELVSWGNTIIVEDNDQQMLNHSDWVIELAPAETGKGSMVAFQGTPKQRSQARRSAE